MKLLMSQALNTRVPYLHTMVMVQKMSEGDWPWQFID